ncbi:MAG: heavy metal translocating P-type ATPase [Nitrososphaerota archaeon]|nr:heavy metal translocating P-type ATPase [Nitrososphaerota archaeon]
MQTPLPEKRTLESPKSRTRKSLVRLAVTDYPIPVFALVGLFAGAVTEYAFSLHTIADWIWFVTLVLGGAPIVWQTLRGMLRGRFASDVVAMLAILAAIVLGQSFAGVIVVLMQSGGEAIEDYGLKRASSSLDALLARAPRFALRKKDSVLEQIDVSSVVVGDVLVVRSGDLIPVDGTITSGQADIDESALTGEPLPRSKSVGDRLMSGSVSVNGAIEMRAEKVSAESEYAKIVELVRKAQEEKPPIQRLADRYAGYFTPITLAVCLLGFLITLNYVTILAVLVVATPCPLILATPVAVISGVNRAAEEGIIVKGGAAIEQVGRAQVVVFDKTGTITFGTPFIERISPIDRFSEDELLYKAASVEQLSSHVVARSITRMGMEKFGSLPVPTNFRESPGSGIEAEIEGRHIVIGSKGFLERSIGSEEFSKGFARLGPGSQGKLLAYIGIDHQLAGVIIFTDQIRPTVPTMLERLHQLGVKRTVMLTGDNIENALTIAKQAGIAHVDANLLPEEKVEAVKNLKNEYDSVVMVGDGINDAPALATATVGVAMGAHGTGISAEAADMVLLEDDIARVSDAVFIGQRMVKIAKQGIFFGLGCSFVLMGIAAFGFIPPAIGAMSQEVIDAAVILNALRAR